MKLLVTCAGRRDELLSYFKNLPEITELHAADIDQYAPAFEQCHFGHIVPSVFEIGYIESILSICKTHQIDFIFSINDLELQKLAEHKAEFKAIGTFPLLSDSEVIKICCDKSETNRFLKANGFVIPADYQYEEVQPFTTFPLIIKPRFGTASIGVEVADSFDSFILLYQYAQFKVSKSALTSLEGGNDLLIQTKVKGVEYAVDIINDLEKNYVGSIIKRKIGIRGGDAALVITEHHHEIELACQKLANCLKHIGNLDVDIIYNESGVYFVDLNPRFGGAYPFSFHSGVHLPKMIISWLNGKPVEKIKYESGIITARTERYMQLTKYHKLNEQ